MRFPRRLLGDVRGCLSATALVVALNFGCAMLSLLLRNSLSRALLVVVTIALAPRPMSAQQSSMAMTKPDTTRVPMMSVVPDPLGVPMDRMGSGTTWMPDAVSLPSRHYAAGQWDLMVHGFVFVEENVQGGPRGASQFGSLNWGMFMASHELAGGRFQARTMLSLDAATVTGRGYPLLLQTGETFQGVGLHDRQHPHDFLMELGVLYERPITKSVGITFYGAPSGEPALGPVAFMHRPSAMDMPIAPITHHWQDATHVSFGVLTAGLFGHSWKLEASKFNGREPDENRWDIDRITLDSYSGRLTVNPTATWSVTGGYGYIKSHDVLNPDQGLHRITASAMHGERIGTEGQWSSTVVWGANKHAGQAVSNGVLAESEAILDRRNTILGRVAYLQVEAGDLAVDTPPLSFPSDHLFDVGNVSLGFIREVARWQGTTIGLGLMGTVNAVPSALESTYGSRTPLGGLLFLRLRPFHATAGHDMPGMKSP
jgi:hypothetical protein